MEYGQALALQRRVHALRVRGLVPDVLLTVEHDPVFTRGRSAGPLEYRAALEEVDRAAIPVVDVERGGAITYHGPGQLVAYPIVDLRNHGRDVKRYVATLEDAAIATLNGFGIRADRRPGYPGVWVEAGKIASIGIYVREWVTRHGLALNVSVDPTHFGMIDPCGLPVRAVSMSEVLGTPIRLVDVEAAFASNLAERLGWRLERRAQTALLERVCA